MYQAQYIQPSEHMYLEPIRVPHYEKPTDQAMGYTEQMSSQSPTTTLSPIMPLHDLDSPGSSASPQPPKPRRRGAKSQYTAEEKEKRRKISHSAIEKRRRERTNNVLNQLQLMVPGLKGKVQKLDILLAVSDYIKSIQGDLKSKEPENPMNISFLLS
ncbi:hypothetical protein LPJ78_000168 [Coemansia sp. RSA 989]|nr:hypothetical protein BX667DRAFT_497279 [Coemansia mojavensis]KAJ1742594.1 hypothetical protein LPJ68_001744 [Coemansia sp. RSA 1086]KAJ1751727.1 hypothetical protein LPJ79_001795 [Coemansia sp. RSA 1821]KAJ1868420.1 hypothetical protein LPJ78_000168 [Coemansia sp. RSA 989]KAJ1875148.1 hypothetical protein LPJ55_000959 [Coemansia sp. RSA 990]KAJ2630223.1 hypothetical protein H4R22_002814 [Coemansia sp. RSA 1290]KAJ2652125.1 hypothetical protein IWW40_001322 [Coemansia sp. RSA 1250]KAJ26751